MHIAGKDEHVGDIERLIRLIKERVRAILSTLPFKKVPKVILRYLVRLVVLLLNVVPPRSGTVPFYESAGGGGSAGYGGDRHHTLR